MKKRLVVFMMLIAILSGIIVNFRHPRKYMVEDDREIEWHSYNDENVMWKGLESANNVISLDDKNLEVI